MVAFKYEGRVFGQVHRDGSANSVHSSEAWERAAVDGLDDVVISGRFVQNIFGPCGNQFEYQEFTSFPGKTWLCLANMKGGSDVSKYGGADANSIPLVGDFGGFGSQGRFTCGFAVDVDRF